MKDEEESILNLTPQPSYFKLLTFTMIKNLLSFRGRYRVLHLTWFAFFLTFVDWFNFAPFATTIGKNLSLDPAQIKVLGICNLALTIPARIIIGMVLDRFGPRVTFSSLLAFSIVPCFVTAFSNDFNQLVIGRLLMGIVGAGFVVGIRMVSEWFPPKEIGSAEGIYGGWGNFGAFAAEFTLPVVAIGTAFLSGGASNWRVAIALTGIISTLYGLVYFKFAQDTPKGKTYKRPKKSGGMEVTSVKSFWAMMVMNFGLIVALGLLAWRLQQVKFFNVTGMLITWGFLAALYAYQSYQAYQVNRELLTGRKRYSTNERYQFRQVALLEFTYVISFGSELAAISMLPAFFEKTFHLDHTIASMLSASYPFLNLVSRPSGGWISDRMGSRKWTMTVIAAAIGFGYLFASEINTHWAIPMAIAVTMFSAWFAQAGCGATYGIVPLIKKEITGQIAGNVGAYGNFGGVVYLTVYSLTNARTLFTTMGIAALVCASLCAFFLQEPRGSFAEEYDQESQLQGDPLISRLLPEQDGEQ
jgi:NNP family nitrate/nitrite transporter-like MFS transporter